ncbi:hypothetical protein [Bdellovibrio sp.]|uniref:hypothetical protein n=1 Tax=Bdellovibrio sp. TaxID=28201 RepID=UPI0039E4D82B
MTKSAHHLNALQVRQALWALQKEVLNSLKEEFDRENGYAAAPTEWFQVLMTAERYVWLRELTSLMADIDILTELDFITDQHAGIARFEIERLLFDQDSSESFNNNYRDLLMSGTSLLPLHSQLRASLQNLPKAETSKDQSHAERKSWHEEHRHQSRKKRN